MERDEPTSDRKDAAREAALSSNASLEIAGLLASEFAIAAVWNKATSHNGNPLSWTLGRI
jgi:hypothetical protein